MPLDKNGQIRCINHKKTVMIQQRKTYALVDADEELTLDREFDMTISVYICPACGYIELYLERG